MAKQSKKDRLKRLAEGRCPIHGIGFSQIGLEDLSFYCEHHNEFIYKQGRFLVECGRKTCGIKAYTHSQNSPAELLPEFQYLIE